MREANGPAESKDPYRHEHRRTEQGVLSLLDQSRGERPGHLELLYGAAVYRRDSDA
jgi:hypothetical protein